MFRHLVLLVTALFVLGTPVLADGLDAAKAFEHLQSLEGTWTGIPDASGLQEVAAEEQAPPPQVVHEMKVSAAGTVVMETMNPGTDHEMINMYHLDGEELVLTHYCAGGNQPTMRLDRERSTAEHWVFVFTGGTNLDPEVDGHIRNAELRFEGTDRLESRWGSYNEGKPMGEMVFHLQRGE